MFHFQGRLIRRGASNDFRGHAGHRGVRGNIFQYYATRPPLGSFTDTDIAQNFGAGAGQHALG